MSKDIVTTEGQQTPCLSPCSTLPRAMVLVYQPELSCSVWQDFECRARSIGGLERQLKQGVRCGDWAAWRLMRIEKEVMGNE